MKSNYFFNIIAAVTVGILIVAKLTEGLQPSDLCLASQEYSCIKMIDRFRCEKRECTGGLNQACGNGLCAKDDLACQIYQVKESM